MPSLQSTTLDSHKTTGQVTETDRVQGVLHFAKDMTDQAPTKGPPVIESTSQPAPPPTSSTTAMKHGEQTDHPRDKSDFVKTKSIENGQ